MVANRKQQLICCGKTAVDGQVKAIFAKKDTEKRILHAGWKYLAFFMHPENECITLIEVLHWA